jgi:hypothetical protein
MNEGLAKYIKLFTRRLDHLMTHVGINKEKEKEYCRICSRRWTFKKQCIVKRVISTYGKKKKYTALL